MSHEYPPRTGQCCQGAARIATLEARIAELTRERGGARGALDALNTAFVAYVRSSCDEVKRLRGFLDEMADDMRAARAERDEALSRPTLAQVEVERQSHRQALDQLRAVAAERDEAVGLLREWLAEGRCQALGLRERWQRKQEVVCGKCTTCQVLAYLARLAVAPEKTVVSCLHCDWPEPSAPCTCLRNG